MTALTELTAVRLVDRYRQGAFSPVEATRAAMERADLIQPGASPGGGAEKDAHDSHGSG